jgi:mono/diheme cytochrome c family protein
MNTRSGNKSLKTLGLTRLTSRFVLAAAFSVVLAAFGTAQPQTATAPAGNAQNGKKIFATYGCYECHGTAAQGAPTGPRLGPHPIALTAVIHELRHPNEMPPYTEKVISDAQIADVYAFLQSLPDPPKPDSIPLLSKQ